MESFERFEQVLHIPAVVCALELSGDDAESFLRDKIRAGVSPELALEVLDFVVEANPTAGSGAVHRLLTEASNSPNPLVAAYGLGALLSFDEGEPSVVIEFATSPDRELRVIALIALTKWWDRLGHTSSGRERVSYHEAVVQGLSDPSIAVVLAAIDALGHFAFPDDVELLEPLLQSEDSMIRVRAASALLRLRRRATSWGG
jgi:HEAT repeat protein